MITLHHTNQQHGKIDWFEIGAAFEKCEAPLSMAIDDNVVPEGDPNMEKAKMLFYMLADYIEQAQQLVRQLEIQLARPA
jgi:hypothetical protein